MAVTGIKLLPRVAGDGYTHHMDLITEGFENLDHCVDDYIIWDKNIKENFFRVCSFIEKCSCAGCIFNPSKFQFGRDTVQFLGFEITSIQLPKKFLDKIRNWFGLINQVSFSFAMTKTMAPFRRLLSSKVPFAWSEELEVSFNNSKKEIIEHCFKGIRSLRLGAPTALATDWSKLG